MISILHSLDSDSRLSHKTIESGRVRPPCQRPLIPSMRPSLSLMPKFLYWSMSGVFSASALSKRRALGNLAGRFAFKSWASGEMLVPESALPFLAVQGVPFTDEGPGTYEQNGPTFRGIATPAIQ